MKPAPPQYTASSYPIRRPKDLSLQHDRFKFATFRLFVAKAISYKKTVFCHSDPIVKKNGIFRQSG